MYIHGKADWIANIIFNLILAFVLSAVAELVNAGGIQWPLILIDTAISFVLEMLIVMFLPLVSKGFGLASKHAKPGALKFRAIMATVVAIPFAIIMSLCMSFYSTILILHLPVMVWIMGWLRIVLLFIALAWICVFVLLPPIMAWAHKTFDVKEN